MDIGKIYLNTKLDRYEYMKFHLWDLLPEIIEQYNLKDVADEKG